MVEAGFHEVETYVSLHQNTFVHFIAARSIIDLCLAEEQRPGSKVSKRWWDMEVLDMLGMRAADWGDERTEGGGGGTDRAERETETY